VCSSSTFLFLLLSFWPVFRESRVQRVTQQALLEKWTHSWLSTTFRQVGIHTQVIAKKKAWKRDEGQHIHKFQGNQEKEISSAGLSLSLSFGLYHQVCATTATTRDHYYFQLCLNPFYYTILFRVGFPVPEFEIRISVEPGWPYLESEICV